MKRWISLLLVICTICCLVGCGKAEEKETPQHYDRIVVAVSDIEPGSHIEMWADVDVENGFINITNPIVLAFALADKYDTGLVQMTGEELDSLREALFDGDIDAAMEIIDSLAVLFDCPT